MTINKTTAILGLTCALLFVVLCWKMCDNRPEVVINNYKDSALNIVKSEKELAEAALKFNQDSLFRVQEARRMDSAKIERLSALVVKADEYTRRLHAEYVLLKNDTTINIHLPLYDICDSLANQAIINNATAIGYKEVAEQLSENYKAEIEIWQRSDSIHQHQIKAQREAFQLMVKAYNKLTPRAKLYAGAKAFGSKETIISGVGGSGLLVTKNGRAYSLGAGMLHTGKPYIEAGAYFLISFR